jgi:enoyl-[acyl-carrier protein] reductase II
MWSGREDQVPQDETARQIIGTTVLGGQVYQMPKYSAIVPTRDTQGDFEEMCMPAGDGAPRIRRVQPAAAIIREMMTEASEYLA